MRLKRTRPTFAKETRSHEFLFFAPFHDPCAFVETFPRAPDFLLCWLLMPLGQNAPYAYTMHFGVIALWYIALRVLPANARMIAEINTSIQLCAVLAIWGMIRQSSCFALCRAETKNLPGLEDLEGF